MNDTTLNIFFILMVIVIGLYIAWQNEKNKKEKLQGLIFRINSKLNLLESIQPQYYVPTRHHHPYGSIIGEKMSPYQECLDYELLEGAIRYGKYLILDKENK